MSIRTHLANIARPRGRPPIERRGRIVAVMLLAGVLLTGCSSGGARESARDEAKDAAQRQVLAAEQATRTVERYFPATATPKATEAPAPALGDLAITFGFRPDGTPDGSFASVPAGAGAVYAAAYLVDLSAGQVVRAVVTDAWGNEIARPEVAIDPGAADRWLALPIGLSADVVPGEYGVFILAGDRTLGSLAFGVTAAGTSAQLFPDPPANPQVRATLPPPGGTRVEAGPTPTPAPVA